LDEDVSRRRLLAGLGTALAGGLAGCSFGVPQNTETTGTGTPGSEASSGEAETDLEPVGTPADIDVETPVETPQAPADSEYTEVYRRVVDSVTAISVRSFGGGGSGTAWMYDDRHLVTNEHVVGDAESAAVRFSDQGWRDVTVVGTDVYSDLGVVRVQRSEAPDDAAPLPLVESEQPVGTEVLAIGNPFGLSGSVSAGIISGNNRTLDAANDFSIPDAIQTDAAANPGNSGGPLVTLDGAVAGVINSGISSGDNVSFAISAGLTERVVPALIADGEYDHSFMGIRFSDVGPLLARANNLPITWGIYVAEAVDGGPADGILRGSTGRRRVDGQRVPAGGDVIVTLGDQVVQTQQQLGSYLALETSPGDTITVGVIRDAERVDVELTLGARPES
jgi:S1-C subfamily serine protease